MPSHARAGLAAACCLLLSTCAFPRRDVEPRRAGVDRAQWCGPVAYKFCKLEADQELALCQSRQLDCDALCRPPPSQLCAGCLAHNASCQSVHDATIAQCGQCPASLTCSQDIGLRAGLAGYNFCCSADDVPCNGACVSPTCPPRRALDRIACSCSCAAPYVEGKDSACVCPENPECTALNGYLDDACNCYICQPPTEPCGQKCVDTSKDRANCGSCGNACTVGQDCCGGACADLNRDPNCGSCGTVCATAGQACCPWCSPHPSAACNPYYLSPSETYGHCVDLQTDANDCGACINICGRIASGTVCSAGKCVCPAGKTGCGAACVDLQTDPAHCGSCANRCGPGRVCQGGVCVCPQGQAACGGACCNTGAGESCCGTVCKNLQTDAANCGACGKACNVAGGEVCFAGQCSCPLGSGRCGGVCCPSGQTCSSGKCCPAGATNCGGACVNTGTDLGNCGACGVQCGPTSWCEGPDCVPVAISCTSGQCVCPTDWTPCSTKTNCCPPAHPVCSGLIGPTQWGPRYLCCDAGEVGCYDLNLHTPRCCAEINVVNFTDGTCGC